MTSTQAKKVNWESWACQLFFEYPLGLNGHFKGVKVEPGQLAVKPVLLPEASKRITDFTQAVSQTVDLLQSSVEQDLKHHAQSQPIVFLSGGWDSRALLCALKNVAPRKQVKAYTTSYDSGNNKEEVFASLVAQELDIPHEIISLSENYYKEFALEAIQSSDFSTPVHIWMVNFLRQLNFKRRVVNFDGYAGDILFRGMRQDLDDEKLAADDPAFFNRLAVLHPKSVLPGPVYKSLEKLARNALARELACYPAETRMLNFLLNNRGARGVAHSIGIQGKFIDVALPFLNQELLQHTVNIDSSLRLDPRFYPEVLNKLNPKVASLPSTNCAVSYEKLVKTVPQFKHSESNLSWMTSNIERVARKHGTAGGLIDWYTLTPLRTANKKKTGRDLAWHMRALESLHVYSQWYERHHNQLLPDQNIFSELLSNANDTLVESNVPLQVDYEGVIHAYVNKIQKLERTEKLLFNFTMDVEAFGFDDYYSSHTADGDIVEKLFYSNFGDGSNIQKLLFDRQIPCTYFIEPYTNNWKSSEAFKRAIDFYSNDFSEIGLHCHAFSLPENIAKELQLDLGWAFLPDKYAEVLHYGKKKIELALGRGTSITSFRSGRLDIYPESEYALKQAGFLIDSSLIDGVNEFHYQERTESVGNGLFVDKGITQIPITSFRVGKRTTSLNFNSSSFESICEIIYQAIQDGLPCLTMLSHSWSFSKVVESALTGKKIHVDSDPSLIEKFNRLVEFVEKVPNIEFCTLNETAKRLEKRASVCQPASNLNTKPELLSVQVQNFGDEIVAKCFPLTSRIEGEIEFAFYLMSGNEKVAIRMYSNQDKVCFVLPSDLNNTDELIVRAYIRIVGDKTPHSACSQAVPSSLSDPIDNDLNLPRVAMSRADKKALEVKIVNLGDKVIARSTPLTSSRDKEFEYAFYLFAGGEKVDTQMYSSSNEVSFSLPHTIRNSGDLVVRAFIREVGDKKPLDAKSESVPLFTK